MRALVLFVCAIASAVAFAGVSAAQTPETGVLSVEHARGSVLIELRGSLLGRLSSGTLRVTDLTPRDRFEPIVTGKKLLGTRVGPRTVLYRGQGLRFRMVGGRYRIALRGFGGSVSAVGRGWVILDGDPRVPFEDVGVYSLDEGVDCELDAALCLPLPVEPERFAIGTEEAVAAKGGS
jgi:hypothetical protein